ncbi:MAG: serine/threonine-protein kinase [Pseudomonadota bacterium]|nr:MAG: serine/threonine protein kinase [Pseudomonadota bacterium]
MDPATQVSQRIREGAVIAGKYRLESMLARGGMGLIYRARHLVLDRPVAIKIVKPELMHRRDAVARFLNEARSVATLESEHVARVLDAGWLKDGPPYMVLEYLEGADLRTVLNERGPFAVERAVDLVLQVCEALAEAHRAGIVHRDVKPENLFLTRRSDGTDCIKLLDFGISKRNDPEKAAGRSYTVDGQSLGSPHYMAPEQMASPGRVDARADIWSVGVVLFEMLCGQPPFDGETVPTVCAQVLCREPPTIEQFHPGVPAELSRVIARCLSKSPEARPATVERLAEELAAFATSLGATSLSRIRSVRAAPVVPLPDPLDHDTLPDAPPSSDVLPQRGDTPLGTGKPARKRPLLRVLAASAAASLAALAASSGIGESAAVMKRLEGTAATVRAFATEQLARAGRTEDSAAPGRRRSAPECPSEGSVHTDADCTPRDEPGITPAAIVPPRVVAAE